MPLWCRPGSADEDEKAMAASSLAQRRAGPSVVPVPEPDLMPRELIARAAALKPLLRAQQTENDERGAYSPELHEAFVKAGLYRTVQPRLFGVMNSTFRPSTGRCSKSRTAIHRQAGA
jgi:hypothetical protein